jgi:hypothetical protein
MRRFCFALLLMSTPNRCLIRRACAPRTRRCLELTPRLRRAMTTSAYARRCAVCAHDGCKRACRSRLFRHIELPVLIADSYFAIAFDIRTEQTLILRHIDTPMICHAATPAATFQAAIFAIAFIFAPACCLFAKHQEPGVLPAREDAARQRCRR